MSQFRYSEEFEQLIVRLHRGKEHLPQYAGYVESDLGGPRSRLVRFTRELVPEVEYRCGGLQGKRILDFGCGTGAATIPLAQRADDVSAFDVEDESIGILRQRLREHGMEGAVRVFCAADIEDVRESLGTFDIVILNAVLEHIPLSVSGLRRHVVRSAFSLLREGGYLFIHDTPNRLWPVDFHTTQLAWIPWMRPGSARAYRKALRSGRYADTPRVCELEERGAWGVTYWEILGYLDRGTYLCLNTQRGQDRQLYYTQPGSRRRALVERLLYYTVVKVARVPTTAVWPMITSLVIQRRGSSPGDACQDTGE